MLQAIHERLNRDLSVDEDSLVKLTAKLALHEQLLETLCAEHFDTRVCTGAAIDAFRQALIKRIQEDSSASKSAGSTFSARIADESASQAEAFTEKISLRVASYAFRFK